MTRSLLMKTMNRKQRGFTLIELVLVIAILGVLAVAALPSLFDVSLTAARTNSMKATAAAVQTGLSLYAASQLAAGAVESYPALLETTDLADGTAATGTNQVFNQVLQTGVSAQWFKVDDDCYAFDTNGNAAFDDGTDTEFQYVNTTGVFNQAADCG